jgi:putative membrane protein
MDSSNKQGGSVVVYFLLLYLKGIAMGCADVVPGVSGGTIAFITGIYTRLLDAIKAVDLDALNTLFKKGIKAAWQQVDGSFLVTLLAGILTAIATLAKVIGYLMETYPIFLWAFFFGLILAASWHMLKQIPKWDIPRAIALLIGIAVTTIISLTTPGEIAATPWNLFFGGAIAISAMILPGISGGFLLLLMGLYAPVLVAAKSFDIATLSWLILGAVCGLLAFSRLLSWLLHQYQYLMYALLTGFMLGALLKIWPWKETLSFRTNSQGEQVPFIQTAVLPDFNDLTSLSLALLCAATGFAIVVLMERLPDHSMDK